jgi:hypothetical protein
LRNQHDYTSGREAIPVEFRHRTADERYDEHLGIEK